MPVLPGVGGNKRNTTIDTVMDTQFDQIRNQIHEIRNFLAPLDLKLEGLDHQINKSRISFEARTSAMELKMAEQSLEIARHSEQIRLIQMFLKMPQSLDDRPPAPVHEDRLNPIVEPPINPAK
jgi:hypothetical protein